MNLVRPIVLATALARWTHPERGVIGPDVVPIAEDSVWWCGSPTRCGARPVA